MGFKLIVYITIIVILFYILYIIFYTDNKTIVKNKEDSLLDTEVVQILEDNTLNKFIDNKIISGKLQLKPVKYETPRIKSSVKFIDLHDFKELKKYKNNQNIIKSNNTYNLYIPDYNILRCEDIANQRCNVPPAHSTRCLKNECQYSTFYQCTNNTISHNNCECRANELCELPIKISERCYKNELEKCKKK